MITFREFLTELSKGTLGIYVKKVAKTLGPKEVAIDDTYRTMWDAHQHKKNFRKGLEKQERQVANHHKGIERATNRLMK